MFGLPAPGFKSRESERVTRKFLEVSLCSRVKQRHKNIQKGKKKSCFCLVGKKVCCTCKGFFFFFGNKERLPFVWKTRKFRGEFKWNGFILVEIFREKSNTFRGITFFPFLAKQPKFSVPFVWITSTRLQVERKRKIYRYFVNGTLNPVPVFGPKKKKKYQYHLTEVFTKFPYKW